MVVMDNVIKIDHATWYCMRQCQESLKDYRAQKNPKYDLPIKGETEIYQTFMKEVLGREAA